MNRVLIALTALLSLLLVGCGGSGGSGGGSSSGGNAAVFITDDLTTGYDHVWVTIKSISVGKVGGGSTVVFSEADGVQVDLRSLRDADGRRFQFLAFAENLAGTYDSVTVVLDDDVVLYPTGSNTGLKRTFDGSVNGEKTLTATFDAKTFTKGSDDDLIIDFDLSKWNDNGTFVTDAVIVVLEDDPDFDDHGRHDRRSYPGRINNLIGTAPNQTFTLRRGNHEIDVRLNSETSIERLEDNSGSALQNGMHVVVRGFFDTTANVLVAERVKITGNDDDEDNDEAYGTAINIDAVAGSFDMDVDSAEGFVPASNPIHVTSTATTKYRAESGDFVTRAEFFAMVTATTVLEVEGQYDSLTNTLVATKIKVDEDDDEDNHEAEIAGATSSVDAVLGTFVVTVESFSGINVNLGDHLNVVVDSDTEFRGLGGTGIITREQFFAALAASPGHDVEVEGHWDGTTFFAEKVKLED